MRSCPKIPSELLIVGGGSNLKELLVPSNPNRAVEPVGRGCIKYTAKRCECCKHFLVPGGSFSSAVTGRLFSTRKTLTCTSVDVVYLALCVACGLQGVGSTHNFKPRLANYKSHMKHRRRTCGVVDHFIDKHDGEHSNLKFILFDSNNEDLRKCVKTFGLALYLLICGVEY